MKENTIENENKWSLLEMETRYRKVQPRTPKEQERELQRWLGSIFNKFVKSGIRANPQRIINASLKEFLPF